jgi:hypothetical protein
MHKLTPNVWVAANRHSMRYSEVNQIAIRFYQKKFMPYMRLVRLVRIAK